jgi:hypothetical protein
VTIAPVDKPAKWLARRRKFAGLEARAGDVKIAAWQPRDGKVSIVEDGFVLCVLAAPVLSRGRRSFSRGGGPLLSPARMRQACSA